MPTPTRFRLTLTVLDGEDFPLCSQSQWFEAFHSGSCTLAQHYAAKLWYEAQIEIERRLADAKEKS